MAQNKFCAFPLDDGHPSPNRHFWFASIALGMLLLLLFGVLDERDARVTAAERAAPAAPQRQFVFLDDCPPPAPGYTDTVILVIRSQADLQPTVTRCARMAIKKYRPRTPLKLSEAK